jgi:hypothetical protein
MEKGLKFWSLGCAHCEDCGHPLIARGDTPHGKQDMLMVFPSKEMAEIEATRYKDSHGKLPLVKSFIVKEM